MADPPLGTTPATGAAAVQRLVTQGAGYTVARSVQIGATALVLPVLSRLLDPEAMGVVATALLVTQLVMIAASLGLHGSVAREWFEGPTGPGDARTVAILSALLGLVLTALVDVTGPRWGAAIFDGGWSTAMRVAVWTGFGSLLVGLAQSLLRASERVAAFSAVTVGAVLGGQLLGVAAVATGDATATNYLWGLLIGHLVAGALGFAVALRGDRSRAVGELLTRSLMIGLPLVPHLLGWVVINLGDRLVVERELGSTFGGRYQVAYVAGALVMTLVAAVNNAWSTLVLAADDETRWPVLHETSRAVLALTVLASAGISLGAPLILSIVAPQEYDPVALHAVTVVVAVSGVPYVTYLRDVSVLFQLRWTTPLLVLTPAAAGLNVGLNLLLVPRHGLIGAAVATLLAYASLAAGIQLVRQRRLRLPSLGVGPFLVAGLAAGLALILPASEATLWLRGGMVVLLALVFAGRVAVMAGARSGREWDDPTSPGHAVDVSAGTDDAARVHAVVSTMSRRSLGAVLEWVDDSVGRTGSRLVTHVNAHALDILARDDAFQGAFTASDLVLCDSSGGQLASRVLRGHSLPRISYSDLIGPLLDLADVREWRLYLLGSTDATVADAARNVAATHGGLVIGGHRDGFFDDAEIPGVVAAVVAVEPDLVLVGMGMPRQEQVALACARAMTSGLVVTCGAGIDRLAGRTPDVPRWIAAVGMEWLVRLGREPGRLWRRYLIGLPRAARAVLRARRLRS